MIDVMVIEDDERVRRILKKMIEKVEGFSVVSEAAAVKEAIDAYDIYAFDYIVKPYNMDRVIRTLNRIKDSGEFIGRTAKPNSVASADNEPYKDKLAVKGKEEILFIDIKDIVFIERINGTTRIVTRDGIYNTSLPLTDVEKKLNTVDFIRCHRSYIINLSKIIKLTQYGRWTYSVSFRDCTETALMTHYNYEKIKEMFL